MLLCGWGGPARTRAGLSIERAARAARRYGVKTLDDGEVCIAVFDARQEVLSAQVRWAAERAHGLLQRVTGG